MSNFILYNRECAMTTHISSWRKVTNNLSILKNFYYHLSPLLSLITITYLFSPLTFFHGCVKCRRPSALPPFS